MKERYERVQSENEKLKTEIESLKYEIKKQGSRSHKIALQLLAITAIGKYNFKAGAQRNTAISKIAGFAQLHGINIDNKTILKYIRAGVEALPKEHGAPLTWEENESPADEKFR